MAVSVTFDIFDVSAVIKLIFPFGPPVRLFVKGLIFFLALKEIFFWFNNL